jgi:hypothetical protein
VLERVDRVQLAVADREPVAGALQRLIGAEIIADDAVAPLGARRTTLRAGFAEFELLTAEGDGPVARHLARSGPGLFAAGFASARFDDLRTRLVDRRVSFAEAGDQLFLDAAATGGHGMRAVVTAARESPPPTGSGAPLPASTPPGLVTALYEFTNVVEDADGAARGYAELFALDAGRFCPIESAAYGYRGTLTLFDRATRLDRVEVIAPYDFAKTMGRFMRKHGESLYMCFAEAPDLAPIRDRLRAHAPRDWTDAGDVVGGDSLFIHPRALGGVMLGVSRTTVGWLWSGHPERVRAT